MIPPIVLILFHDLNAYKNGGKSLRIWVLRRIFVYTLGVK